MSWSVGGVMFNYCTKCRAKKKLVERYTVFFFFNPMAYNMIQSVKASAPFCAGRQKLSLGLYLIPFTIIIYYDYPVHTKSLVAPISSAHRAQ